jgi:hypothetical protein
VFHVRSSKSHTHNDDADTLPTNEQGLDNGISQIARKSTEQVFSWNYPLDITFRSTNVHGWPQVCLSVYGINMWGKDVIRGYGSTFVPTTPGRHVRYVRLFTPVSSSICRQVTSWLVSNPPEFFDSTFIAQGKGREVTRVQSSGTVKIVFVRSSEFDDPLLSRSRCVAPPYRRTCARAWTYYISQSYFTHDRRDRTLCQRTCATGGTPSAASADRWLIAPVRR